MFENLSKSLIFRDFYFELLSLAKKVDFLRENSNSNLRHFWWIFKHCDLFIRLLKPGIWPYQE